MNSLLMRESELEINAYLNSLSLHQSFEQDDTDDEFCTINPSGSVLQPASNPYNKQKRIAEANEILFAEEVSEKSPQRVKFNKVEKRICYDYFGSSFESDSIKSYEDDEIEKDSLLRTNASNKEDTRLEEKGNYLQPQNPASKVVLTVLPKESETAEHLDSESEDVCVGNIKRFEDSVTTVNQGVIINEVYETSTKHIKDDRNTLYDTDKDDNKNTEVKNSDCIIVDKEINQNANVESVNAISAQVSESIVPALVDLEIPKSPKYTNSFNNDYDIFPCLVNHSGITIRITGADSIESVDSDTSDNELQLLENYNNFTNVEFGQDISFPMSKLKNINIKARENIMNSQKQTFFLKGTKTKPSVRTPKQNVKYGVTATQQRFQQRKNEKGKQSDNKIESNKQCETHLNNNSKYEKHRSKVIDSSRTLGSESKYLEDNGNKKTDGCIGCSRKARPKSGIEKESRKVKVNPRPVTAPAKRTCCPYGQPHLPEYNGLRSEYGLSAEQLLERKRIRVEAQRMLKQRREQKFKEEQEKRKENEATFMAWLENKKKQAQMQILRNQKLQAESGIKIYPAPTAHLKKTGAVRSRKRFKPQRKCVSLEEILNNAGTHEKKTYKIYLGLTLD